MRYLLIGISLILFSCEYFHTNPAKGVDIYLSPYLDLMIAAKNEDLGKMEHIVNSNHLMLDYADSKEGISLLNWCLINRKEKSFQKLLQLGANPNWQDEKGAMAPPITEASALDSSGYLKLCLKYGGNPNLLSKKWHGFEQQTPLFAAVAAGVIYPQESMDNLRILLNAGADVNLSRDSTSSSPLAEALILNKIEMAKYLIDRGADYNNLKFRISTIALDSNGRPLIDNQGTPTIKYGEKLDILHFLRKIEFPLGSDKYKIKIEIVNFLQTKGLNYWKYPIPKEVIDNHKGDTTYLKKY